MTDRYSPWVTSYFPIQKPRLSCHGGLRTFVGVMVQFVGRAAHRERIGRDEHHVRGWALQQHAVKLLRREMGCHVCEDDSTETVAHSAQLAPDCEIRRAKDGVNARRPGECKLKRSKRLSQPGELNRQWVSEHIDTLIAQSGDVSGQIRGGQG